MNISQESVDALNAVIRIHITPDDYQPKIEEQLRQYGRRVSMPGFRAGKVPPGMIRKMYGKSILVDELNKLTSDSLFGYIREKQLDILGNPLPKPENDEAIDLENPGDINFAFEVGLAPKFELDISPNHRFNLYMVLADDTFISETVENYRKRLGEPVEVETSEEGDTVQGIFEQLDENGAVLEGGIHTQADIHPEDLKEAKDNTVFIGLSKGQSLMLDVKETFGNEAVIAALLKISKEAVTELNGSFRFTVETIKRNTPAEIDQEFFDRLFGEGEITSDEAMRERIKSDTQKRYRKDAEMRLFNEAVEHLVKSTSFNLPDDFMKRWLASNNEGKVNPADIEANYENYSKGIRWQLIENKIIKENNIAFSQEDVLNKLTDDFLGYMGMESSGDEGMRTRAREIASGMLKNEKEVNKVYDRLYNEAMTQLFLSNFDVRPVELPFEKWVEQLNAPIS